MIKFYWNGIVVTTTTPGYHLAEQNTRYRGVAYGEVWPLAAGDVNWWFLQREAPEAIPDLHLVDEHVKYCLAHKTPVRTLLCATTSDWPLLDEAVVQRLLPQVVRLGYDYWDGRERSYLHYDLFRLPSDESELRDFVESLGNVGMYEDLAAFERMKRRLNEVGLFDELSDLEAFVNARDAFIERYGWQFDGKALFEPFTAYPTDVYELTWPPR